MAGKHRRAWHATAVLTALAVSAGCSSLPTSPRPEPASRSAASPGVWAERTTPEPTPAPEPIPVSEPGPSAEQEPVEAAESSKAIFGRLGGQVSAGSFTVVIPPNAISGFATVRVRQPDVSKPYVRLEISPARSNDFKVPVMLIADASPMELELLKTAVISYFNPATGKWEPVAGSLVDLGALTVSCPLEHFSEYAVEADGKAGW
jgi:hypothetical protein